MTGATVSATTFASEAENMEIGLADRLVLAKTSMKGRSDCSHTALNVDARLGDGPYWTPTPFALPRLSGDQISEIIGRPFIGWSEITAGFSTLQRLPVEVCSTGTRMIVIVVWPEGNSHVINLANVYGRGPIWYDGTSNVATGDFHEFASQNGWLDHHEPTAVMFGVTSRLDLLPNTEAADNYIKYCTEVAAVVPKVNSAPELKRPPNSSRPAIG